MKLSMKYSFLFSLLSASRFLISSQNIPTDTQDCVKKEQEIKKILHFEFKKSLLHQMNSESLP